MQGLDPLTTVGLFAEAQCVGEKKVNGEDYFILKLSADPQKLKLRSEGPVEIIRHVLFSYFSQRTTGRSAHGGHHMIVHAGRSTVTLFRFGEAAMSHTNTRMEEAWSIEEVAFNVPGLPVDCFIPPADIRSGSMGEACELPPPHGECVKAGAVHPARVVAVERAHAHNAGVNVSGRGEKIMWRVEV